MMDDPATEFHDVTDVVVLARYVLELTFDDTEKRVLDVEQYLWGPAFAPLRENYQRFCEVRAGAGTIVWPGNLDLAPELLYERSKPAVPD